MTAVDNKDRYTRRHSEEVTEYALAIPQGPGALGGRASASCVSPALLHDVGKIGIPDRILRKPGSLSEAEYEIVKGHPAPRGDDHRRHPRRRGDPRRRRLPPRALRRQGLPARPGRGGDPVARAHHGRGRHLLGDDEQSSLSQGALARRGDRPSFTPARGRSSTPRSWRRSSAASPAMAQRQSRNASSRRSDGSDLRGAQWGGVTHAFLRSAPTASCSRRSARLDLLARSCGRLPLLWTAVLRLQAARRTRRLR